MWHYSQLLQTTFNCDAPRCFKQNISTLLASSCTCVQLGIYVEVREKVRKEEQLLLTLFSSLFFFRERTPVSFLYTFTSFLSFIFASIGLFFPPRICTIVFFFRYSLFSWNGSFRISISLAACGLSIMNTFQLFSSFRLSFCFCLPNEPTYSGVGKVFQLLFNCIPSDDGSTLRNFSKTKLLVQKYLF